MSVSFLESNATCQAKLRNQLKTLNEKKGSELSALRNEMDSSWKERVQLIQSDLTTLAEKDKKSLTVCVFIL